MKGIFSNPSKLYFSFFLLSLSFLPSLFLPQRTKIGFIPVIGADTNH